MAERFTSVSEDELCEKCIIKQFNWIRFLYDIMNYQNLVSASALSLASTDNTDLDFDNSWYHAQPHPIIVYLYYACSMHTLSWTEFLYIPYIFTDKRNTIWIKDDFQSVLCSLRTLMFINIINGSLNGMRIDVICLEPHTLSMRPFKCFFQQRHWFLQLRRFSSSDIPERMKHKSSHR